MYSDAMSYSVAQAGYLLASGRSDACVQFYQDRGQVAYATCVAAAASEGFMPLVVFHEDTDSKIETEADFGSPSSKPIADSVRLLATAQATTAFQQFATVRAAAVLLSVWLSEVVGAGSYVYPLRNVCLPGR